MNRDGKDNVVLNIGASLMLQIMTFASGLIIPKIVLIYFGSKVNGLVTSLNQFLSFISLLEGGLGSIVLASLYRPLAEKDEAKFSSVIYTANKFYVQIGFFFVLYSVLITLLFPHFASAEFDLSYIALMSFALCFNMIVQYYLSITNRLILEADKKGFIVYITQTIVIFLTTAATVILVRLWPNIFAVKFLRVVIYIIQPIVFYWVTRHDYKKKKCRQIDRELQERRWTGLGQNVAFFIHSNTDVAVLTIFSTLTNVSVYSVYSMIVVGIRTVVITIKNGFIPVIGNCLAKNDSEKLRKTFDIFEYVTINASIIIFGCAYRLILPFVSIYTKDINDADYIQPFFAAVLVMAELLYCVREPHLSVDYADGKFKETRYGAYGEVIINIAVSLVLVREYGLIGVAAGTLCGVLFRLVYHVIYNKYHVIQRKLKYFMKRIIILVISFACFAVENRFSLLEMNSYIEWVWNAVIIFILYSAVVAVLNIIIDKKSTWILMEILKNKVRRT